MKQLQLANDNGNAKRWTLSTQARQLFLEVIVRRNILSSLDPKSFVPPRPEPDRDMADGGLQAEMMLLKGGNFDCRPFTVVAIEDR